MHGEPIQSVRSRCRWWTAYAVLLLATWMPRSATAQTSGEEVQAIPVHISFGANREATEELELPSPLRRSADDREPPPPVVRLSFRPELDLERPTPLTVVLPLPQFAADVPASSRDNVMLYAAQPAPVPAPTVAEQPAIYYTDGGGSSDNFVPVGCSGCGGSNAGVISPYPNNSYAGMGGGCSTCGGGGCVPGRKRCSPCTADTRLGRFLCCLYECICCPDPCYDPRWIPIADSAFFVDAPRPITQTRFRWDSGLNLLYPDRATYFWNRADGMGLGPFPKVPWRGEKSVTYYDLFLYNEIATGLISFFFETSYRSIYPDLASHAAGMGDMNLGTKTLLFDCELFQLSFQLRNYILTGNPTSGLGNGHITLEPSILLGVRLGPDSYLQSQVAEWIPFGVPFYTGAMLITHSSLNQVIYRVLPDVPLVGTLELNTWSFQDGAYTDPVVGSYQKASGYTYVSLGPGLRLFVCDKLDCGVGTAFSVTTKHWAEQLFRAEFRYRF